MLDAQRRAIATAERVESPSEGPEAWETAAAITEALREHPEAAAVVMAAVRASRRAPAGRAQPEAGVQGLWDEAQPNHRGGRQVHLPPV